LRNLTIALLFFSVIGISKNSLGGDPVAGEKRYGESCINCHGPAGKGAASYPKISGKEISYVTAMLETYRDGIEVGPNSSLMIMMAQALTDEEIANLAAYLKDAKYQLNQ
jgi:cytochrome c553